MKYSIALLVLCALCAVTLATSVDKHAKSRKVQQSAQAKRAPESHARKAPESHDGPKSHIAERSATNHIDTAVDGAKRVYDSGAGLVRTAVNNVEPLVRQGISLGTQIAERFINGPGKAGRAADDQLIRKIEKYGDDIRSTVRTALNAITSSSLKPTYEKILSQAKNYKFSLN